MQVCISSTNKENPVWDSKNFFRNWTFINVQLSIYKIRIQIVFFEKIDCEHNALICVFL